MGRYIIIHADMSAIKGARYITDRKQKIAKSENCTGRLLVIPDTDEINDIIYIIYDRKDKKALRVKASTLKAWLSANNIGVVQTSYGFLPVQELVDKNENEIYVKVEYGTTLIVEDNHGRPNNLRNNLLVAIGFFIKDGQLFIGAADKFGDKYSIRLDDMLNIFNLEKTISEQDLKNNTNTKKIRRIMMVGGIYKAEDVEQLKKSIAKLGILDEPKDDEYVQLFGDIANEDAEKSFARTQDILNKLTSPGNGRIELKFGGIGNNEYTTEYKNIAEEIIKLGLKNEVDDLELQSESETQDEQAKSTNSDEERLTLENVVVQLNNISNNRDTMNKTYGLRDIANANVASDYNKYLIDMLKMAETSEGMNPREKEDLIRLIHDLAFTFKIDIKEINEKLIKEINALKSIARSIEIEHSRIKEERANIEKEKEHLKELREYIDELPPIKYTHNELSTIFNPSNEVKIDSVQIEWINQSDSLSAEQRKALTAPMEDAIEKLDLMRAKAYNQMTKLHNAYRECFEKLNERAKVKVVVQTDGVYKSYEIDAALFSDTALEYDVKILDDCFLNNPDDAVIKLVNALEIRYNAKEKSRLNAVETESIWKKSLSKAMVGEIYQVPKEALDNIGYETLKVVGVSRQPYFSLTLAKIRLAENNNRFAYILMKDYKGLDFYQVQFITEHGKPNAQLNFVESFVRAFEPLKMADGILNFRDKQNFLPLLRW